LSPYIHGATAGEHPYSGEQSFKRPSGAHMRCMEPSEVTQHAFALQTLLGFGVEPKSNNVRNAAQAAKQPEFLKFPATHNTPHFNCLPHPCALSPTCPPVATASNANLSVPPHVGRIYKRQSARSLSHITHHLINMEQFRFM
jgi:hypothetical protein